MNGVPRIDRPSSDVFRRCFVGPGRPAVIAGAMAGWRALTAWDWGSLRERIGAVEIGAVVSKSKRFWLDGGTGRPVWPLRRMTVAEGIDRLLADGETGEHCYPAFLPLPWKFPDLLQDISLPDLFDPRRLLDGYPKMCLSPAGGVSPLHFDHVENLLAVVRGRRRFLLAPPARFSRFYHHPCRTDGPVGFSRVDAERPDLDRFPKFRDVPVYECVVEAGEMLYIPLHWWHQIRSLEPSISLSLWYGVSPVHWLNRYGLEYLYEAFLLKVKRLKRAPAGV